MDKLPSRGNQSCKGSYQFDGSILLEVKKSFRDVDNVLYDWTDAPSSDYCVWRGITCDNVTFNVVALNLSGLNLDGEISPAIGQLKGLLSIDLRGNRLSGQIPDEIGDCSALKSLDLSFNELYGDIPFSISKLKQLENLIFKNNQLIGPIPSTLSQIPNLKILSLQNNRFSGQIPSVIGLMQALAVLDLSYNMLSGTIPPILGNLTYTEKLYLHCNKLTGSIPAELGNMTKLHYLELNDNLLTGHIPPELGKLTDLFDLNVANNHLEGPIPDNLSSCTNLNSFNVHGNKLNRSVPLAFQKLESMTYLDLSNNRISGYMPSSLGDLEHLLKLDLSNNHLSGPIPQELGQLQNVFLLKLENNNISGDVMSLANCVSLTVLNVSYNNLVGYIPTGNNFSRFSPDSFLGNPGLCGYWLSSSCHAPRPAERDIMRMTENLSEKYIIGYGASSIVYKCVLKNCRPVAIKKLYSHPHCLKEFETELETVGRTTKKKKLDWDTRVRIALGAAQGLAYLHHDCSPRIIHRDVKSSNILLDKDYEAHLTDFGIAKSLCASKTHTSTFLMGTIGYIDPEYARTSRLTEKSDVYSYGIVLLELLTGWKPILTKAANNSVMDTVDPEISETCKDLGEVKKVFQLALLCTKRQPSDRPTMHEVVRVLGSLIPPPEAKMFAPTTTQLAPLQSHKVQCYVDEYANLKTPHLVNCSSISTSDAQLFLKFGEVISQNSV
ncbi:hypothetical protein DH2020_036715 [Rehmannia glutinosa]|uniref:Protein kinase domain-containing protein n=1 Tax=Rehmannia glutinosa TaxID=99300 RepID=A0ABR0V311_REHGL